MDVIAHPTQAGHQAVLLSDTIVGGTGYLFELASAPSTWDVLIAGLRALETCPCQDEGLAACHRCLLPYVRPTAYEHMRRTAAIEALHILLGGQDAQPGAMQWTVEEREVEPTAVTESPLERRFRNAFIQAMRRIDGADVTARGTAISVRHDGQTFTLDPQVDIAVSRPDFVLRWPGAHAEGIEGIAIFTDGRAFHATAAKNRVADDAVKRMRVRRARYLVLSITDADIDEDAARDIAPEGAGSSGALPPFVDQDMVQQWTDTGVQYRELEPMLRATPLEMLVRIVRRAKTDRLRRLGEELPYLLVPTTDFSVLTTPGTTPLDRVAVDLLDGTRPGGFTDPTRLNVARARDALAVVGKVSPNPRSLTLVLDDRDEALRRESSAESWRAWLHLANLAQGEPTGETLRMTTRSLVEAGIDVASDEARAPRVPSNEGPTATAPGAETPSAAVPAQDTRPQGEPTVPEPAALPADFAAVPERGHGAEEPLSPAWQEALDEAYDETEKQLIGVLARYDIDPPVIGDEYGSGVPLEIAWPERKIGVTTGELEERDRASLEQDGWSIVGPDPETVLAALQLTSGGDS